MKQDRDQSQVLLWTATASLFLFVLFRLRILENIGHSPYVPWIAVALLLIQLINHEQATIALRKKSPNFTNHFYTENGRMILGNVVASALVLEFNIFHYEHSRLNFSLELMAIPFILIVIFLIENSQGGFLALQRIYFPKKWDQLFKAYGVDILSILLMVAMWLPVIFKIPVSAMLWIFMSTLLLKASVTFTNKYNHAGWCFLLEILLTLHLLTLGLQDSQIWLLVIGIITGLFLLAVYMPKMGYEKAFIALAMLLFAGGMAALYYDSHGGRAIVYYLQREIGIIGGILLLNKIGSVCYRKLRKKEEANKYSYAGAVVDKSFRDSGAKTATTSETPAKESPAAEEKVARSRKKTIVLHKAETKAPKAKRTIGKAKPERKSFLSAKNTGPEKQQPVQGQDIKEKAVKKQAVKQPPLKEKTEPNAKDVSKIRETKAKDIKKPVPQAKPEKTKKKVVSKAKKVKSPVEKQPLSIAKVGKPQSVKKSVPKVQNVKYKNVPLHIPKKQEPKKAAVKKGTPAQAVKPKSNPKVQTKAGAANLKTAPKKKTNYFRKKKSKKLVK